MQYDPDRFPVQDYTFTAHSSLGVIAREYEVTQLVQLLQTVGKDSPMYPMLVEAVVENMSLANREQMITKLRELAQPNPEAQQAAQAQAQAQMALLTAQAQAFAAQATEAQARAAKLQMEAQAVPAKVDNDRIRAISANIHAGDQDDKEFERRFKLAELVLREREITSKEEIVSKQMAKQAPSSPEEIQFG
jgi:hypothetical protein